MKNFLICINIVLSGATPFTTLPLDCFLCNELVIYLLEYDYHTCLMMPYSYMYIRAGSSVIRLI